MYNTRHEKQNKQHFCGFYIKICGFSKNFKSHFVIGEFLKIWPLINFSWGLVRSHKTFGPDRFSRFDVYWIQTDRWAKYTYRFTFDLARLHVLHYTCWVDFTMDSLTGQYNWMHITVHVVPARIMQLLDGGGQGCI